MPGSNSPSSRRNMFWSAFRPMIARGVLSSPTKMIGKVRQAMLNSVTVRGTAWPVRAKPKGPSRRLTPMLLCSSGESGSGLL